jgi:hypothetical protein
MRGPSSVLVSLALVVLMGVVSTANAQDAVPGGWSSQVGFQAFSSPGYGGGVGLFGFGASEMGMGVTPLPGDVTAFQNMPAFQVQPQVANGLLPLTNTIRRQSRKRSRR